MMVGRPACSIVVFLALGAAPVLAEDSDEADRRAGLAWMSGDSIRTSFDGQKLAGQYPSGNLWFEHIRPDGRTDYREGEKRWTGSWWVTDREFCFQYPPPGLGGCFRIVRLSQNCFELYDFSGSAAKEDLPPSLDNLWNGRMWHDDRPTTCEQLSTS